MAADSEHGDIIVPHLHFGSDRGLKGRQELVAVGTHSINTSSSPDGYYIILCAFTCIACFGNVVCVKGNKRRGSSRGLYINY